MVIAAVEFSHLNHDIGLELCAVIGSPKVESREAKSNVKFSISECVVCVYFRGRLHLEAKLCHPYR